MTEPTRAVIFLGPTLPVEEARAILDAVYLPPARQADVISAVTTYRPRIIGLVDGVFGQSLSVWHKEILYALSRGVRVYGASSIGALRAAETAEFGMIGIGEVYRMYASGELMDDDEVALAHGDAESGYRPASEPMVNLRKTFEQARDAGVFDGEMCNRWIALAKSMYFPERTLPAILERAAAEGMPAPTIARVAQLLRASYVDVKRQDAILLLQTIRDLPESLPEQPAQFELADTDFFDALYQRDRRVRHSGVEIPLHAIADYAALHQPDFATTSFHAVNRALVVMLAGFLEIDVSPEDVQRELARFRERYALVDEPDLTTWLESNDLSSDELHDLMREVALCRRLQRWLMLRRQRTLNTKLILDELRLANAYETTADAAAVRERILQARYPDLREIDHGDADLRDLVQEHLRETEGRIETDVSEWADEVGFGSLQELRIELLRSRLARRELRRAVSALRFLLEDT
jgi:hypothetical protein